jgi:hypothetical protein
VVDRVRIRDRVSRCSNVSFSFIREFQSMYSTLLATASNIPLLGLWEVHLACYSTCHLQMNYLTHIIIRVNI